jgi:hypothetical protein
MDRPPVQNMIDLQRACAYKTMGEQARQALKDGYPQDADRILDEMAERRRAWEQERVT